MIYTPTKAPVRFPSLPVPRLSTPALHPMFRAAMSAMRAVDRDIENLGAVTYETVEQVRATRALMLPF